VIGSDIRRTYGMFCHKVLPLSSGDLYLLKNRRLAFRVVLEGVGLT
jgi:hypothetical protein